MGDVGTSGSAMMAGGDVPKAGVVPDTADIVAGLREHWASGSLLLEPAELAARARDWWPLARLRQVRGDEMTLPAAVALPRSTEDVATILRWASETSTPVVTRGLGSGVCGAAQPVAGCVVLDMSQMNRVLALDRDSETISVEAGIRGDVLEGYLSPHGLTVGHYPQSIELSTVGGWIALSSAGQASPAFGSIENHVLGLTVVLSDGTVVNLKPISRSAAGPDLRRLIVGSEGTFGVVTEAVLSCASMPGATVWQSFRYETFDEALLGARDMLRAGVGASFLRGYDEFDAAAAFGSLGFLDGCVGLVGFDGNAPGLVGRQAAVSEIATKHGGQQIDNRYGEFWWEHKLDAVALFDRVMGNERARGPGVVLDTFEPSGLWRDLPRIHQAVGDALRRYAEETRCHFSHVYPAGAALYFTFVIKASDDYAVEALYSECWNAAMRACIETGGSVAHHHGMGRLKAGLLEEELGIGAVELLRRLKGALDPAGILNPGALLPVRTTPTT